MRHDESVAARFWAKVEKSAGCWIWTGARNPNGRPSRATNGASCYGRFKVAGRARPAHQVAWELVHGRAFPRSRLGAHRCNEELCVRPEHVRATTHKANMADLRRSGRRRRRAG